MRLPLRLGLVAALLLIVAVPVAVVALVAGVQQATRQPDSRDGEVRALLASAPAWSDPGWRRRADRWLGDRRLHVVVRDAAQRTVYASPGTDPASHEMGSLLLVRDQAGEPGFALLHTSPAEPLLVWLPGLAGLVAALLLVGWLVTRTVLRPLAGLTGAARQVAAGDLDVRPPRTPVGEIDQLGAAFATMAAELDRSIRRQAELEEDGRLFVGMVAHDLRTPLFALRGYLEGLENGVAGSPEMAGRYVRSCIDRAAVLDRRIGDLFAYARLEHLRQLPHRERFDLGGLLAAVVEDAGAAARTRDVRLELVPPARPCQVEADRNMLRRVVENLIDNAIRHTPAGGSVRVAWWPTAEGAVLKVADSGPGVDETRLPHLFSPARRARADGAGLGLTIARRIVLAHGGDLVVRNLPEGGAEFTASIGGRAG